MLRERIQLGAELNDENFGFLHELPDFDELLKSDAVVSLRVSMETGKYQVEIKTNNKKLGLKKSPKIINLIPVNFAKLYNKLKLQEKAL